jgi:hypothetical protein
MLSRRAREAMTSHLDALLGRLAALNRTATPGPWSFAQEGRGQYDLLPPDGGSAFGTLWHDRPGAAEADAALVCALRNALPELLALMDRCRAAESEAERLRSEARLHGGHWQRPDRAEERAPH